MTQEMLQNIMTEMKIAKDLDDAQDMYHIYKRHILPFLRKQVKNLNEKTETKPQMCDCKVDCRGPMPDTVCRWHNEA